MAEGDDEFTVLRKTMRDLRHVQKRLVDGQLADLAEQVRVVRDACYARLEAMGRAQEL